MIDGGYGKPITAGRPVGTSGSTGKGAPRLPRRRVPDAVTAVTANHDARRGGDDAGAERIAKSCQPRAVLFGQEAKDVDAERLYGPHGFDVFHDTTTPATAGSFVAWRGLGELYDAGVVLLCRGDRDRGMLDRYATYVVTTEGAFVAAHMPPRRNGLQGDLGGIWFRRLDALVDELAGQPRLVGCDWNMELRDVARHLPPGWGVVGNKPDAIAFDMAWRRPNRGSRAKLIQWRSDHPAVAVPVLPACRSCGHAH